MAIGVRFRKRKRIKYRSYVLYTGDNLPVLRGIDSDSVNFIYLNPPHNTGETQVETGDSKGISYDDTWTISDMRPEWLDEIEVRCPGALLPRLTPSSSCSTSSGSYTPSTRRVDVARAGDRKSARLLLSGGQSSGYLPRS